MAVGTGVAVGGTAVGDMAVTVCNALGVNVGVNVGIAVDAGGTAIAVTATRDGAVGVGDRAGELDTGATGVIDGSSFAPLSVQANEAWSNNKVDASR